MDATDDLYALLREDASELESRFRRASIQGRGTSQEIADFREGALQSFVSRFFPFPHRITKGKIRDSFGSLSNSIDCIICNPNHPYTVDAQQKFTLLFAEGIDAAIEVKPDIGQSSELTRALQQGLSVKALQRSSQPTLMLMPWSIERSKRVPFGVFAMHCKSDPMQTGAEIVEFYRNQATPAVQQADFFAVNNVGIFAHYIDSSINPWNIDLPNQEKSGWFFEEWKEDTLAGFLWHLQTVAHATIKMQDDVLPKYLAPKGLYSVKKIADER